MAAGPGGGGADLAPDELVFGNAAQLRKMAEALTRGDRTASARAVASARGRVGAYERRHPDADLTQLHGRPLCEAPAPAPAPERARPEARQLRVVTAGVGAAELWVDDYIEPPNMWGEGVSARSVREALDEVGTRDVVVHMNSGGGDYFEGVGIYQALAQHPGDVYVAVDALAASAASVVAMAGDRIGIGQGAFIMIHEASSFAYGNAADMLRIADMLDAVGDQIAGFYATRGNLSAAAFRELMLAETWMGPERAIADGLADEMLALPKVDPQPVDPGADDGDPEAAGHPGISALFDKLRPGATADDTTPPPADPVPAPDNQPVDWGSLFRDDAMEALFP